MTLETSDHAIILFDGVCNLCSTSVQFVIERDKKDHFKFASLQSKEAQTLLEKFKLSTSAMSSFVLIENNKAYTRSTAALKVAKNLPGAWPLLSSLIIIPPFIRNAVYNIIAANRYKWFGKKEACWLPTPSMQKKFL